MSKGVGRVLGVVASIAIPFAAPMIAGAMGLSGAVSGALTSLTGIGGKVAGAFGGAVGGGLVGAAGGALTSIATGQNPWEAAGMGALGGGIAGGIGGWSNATSATAGITKGAAGSTPGPAARTAATVPQVNTAAGPASRTAATVGAEAATSLAPGAAAGNNATLATKTTSLFGNINPNIVRDVMIQGAARVMAGSGYSTEHKAAARRALQLEQEQDRTYFALKNEIEGISDTGRGAEWHAQAKLEGLAATEAAVGGINPNRAGLRTETERRGLHQTALNQTLAYRQGFDSARDEKRAGLTSLAGVPRYNAARDNNEARRQADIDNANRTAGIASTLGNLFAPRLPDAATTPQMEDDIFGTSSTGG